MRWWRLLLAAVVGAVVAAGGGAVYFLFLNGGNGQPVGRGPLAQVGQQEGPQTAAQRAGGSVVRVTVEGGASATPAPTPGAALGGSGTIVDTRGFVLTAQSLVAGASRITVTVPGQKTVDARVVGSDPLTGTSVLKIDGTGYKALTLGNGNPLETGGGIVVMAAQPASEVAVGVVATAHGSIQVDDPAAPGRKRVLNDLAALDVLPREGQLGAPLLDGGGRVLGVVVASGPQSWAADIVNIQPAISQLQDSGRVSYPWLNFDYQQLSATEAAQRGVGAGVLVLKVVPGSAADKAGLKPGDVVTALGGQAMDPAHPLERVLRGLAVHQTVTMAVRLSGGSDKSISAPIELVGQ